MMRTVAISAIPTWPRPIAIPTAAVVQSLTEAVHKWSLRAAGQGSNEVAELGPKRSPIGDTDDAGADRGGTKAGAKFQAAEGSEGSDSSGAGIA